MSIRCETCGSVMRMGYCTYCQEELYILEQQHEYIGTAISEEFRETALAQRRDLDGT